MARPKILDDVRKNEIFHIRLNKKDLEMLQYVSGKLEKNRSETFRFCLGYWYDFLKKHEESVSNFVATL